MHYKEPVYRHPLEGYVPLLQVTVGCSHNKCSFCTMYREVNFSVSKTDEIREDLEELRKTYKTIKRIFLVNGDAFALSADKLADLGEMIIKYIPEVETITGYSSINNLKNKTLDDLKRLKDLRYNDLHIGLESGNDRALEIMNKGYTKEEALTQLMKLKEAGINYDALLMLGAAGTGNGEINANDTAKLLNKTNPYMISVLPTSVFPGSELEMMQKDGIYTVPTELEMLDEEKLLLNLLDIENCYFFGSHRNNLVAISGELPEKRDEIIEHIDNMIDRIDDDVLNGVFDRGGNL